MKGSLKIARIAGIDVFVHWTFGLLLVYVLYVSFRSGQNASQLFWSLALILTVFVIIVLHELGHALTARRYRIKTRGITLLPIGGVAELEKMPEKPQQELLVALAGPLVNVVLATLLFFFVSLPETQEQALEKMRNVDASNFLFHLFYVNVALTLFNLIPAFPMDGGRALRALLAMRMDRVTATLIAARIGQGLAVLFIVAGIFLNPFLIIIGLFVILGAQAEAQQTRTSNTLSGITVGEVVMDHYAALQRQDTVGTAVDHLLHGPSKDFVVFSGGTVVGTLGRDAIIEALATGGKDVPVHQVMNPDPLKFHPSETLEQAWRTMTESNASIAIVFRDARMVGTLDMENIMEYLMVRSALSRLERNEQLERKPGHSPSLG